MKPNSPAFPSKYKVTNDFCAEVERETGGLTIRDYIAIEMMKSIVCSISGRFNASTYNTKMAYRMADALIVESNKK